MKTVKMKIAVACDELGNCRAVGWQNPGGISETCLMDMKAQALELLSMDCEGQPLSAEIVVWVSAEIPLPSEVLVEGHSEQSPINGRQEA